MTYMIIINIKSDNLIYLRYTQFRLVFLIYTVWGGERERERIPPLQNSTVEFTTFLINKKCLQIKWVKLKYAQIQCWIKLWKPICTIFTFFHLLANKYYQRILSKRTKKKIKSISVNIMKIPIVISKLCTQFYFIELFIHRSPYISNP